MICVSGQRKEKETWSSGKRKGRRNKERRKTEEDSVSNEQPFRNNT